MIWVILYFLASFVITYNFFQKVTIEELCKMIDQKYEEDNEGEQANTKEWQVLLIFIFLSPIFVLLSFFKKD